MRSPPGAVLSSSQPARVLSKEAKQVTRVKQLLDLTGRVAVVTGGSIGLGRQMAEGLAEMGANLVLCGRKKEACEQAAHELQTLGVRTLAVGCDVKSPSSVENLVDLSMAQFGHIDIGEKCRRPWSC